MAISYQPSPGIVLVEEITTNTSGIQFELKSNKRTFKGKVVAAGLDLITDFGATLVMSNYAKVGDTVYFLSYEGNYDKVSFEGKDYFVVKIQDLRGVANG